METNKVRNSILMASILSFALFSNSASAANCKSLEKTACGSSTSCSWVEGYERKDGRKVKSFCRAKPSAKKVTASQSGSSKAIVKK